MFAPKSRTIPLTLALLALATCPSIVRAQNNSFNPYGNSGYADYREYATPSASGNTTTPGGARLGQEPLISRQRSNSYQRYIDELEGTESGVGSSRRELNSKLPYYEVNQQQNRLNNRGYKPNNTLENQKFEERLKQRDAAYAKALEEKDLVKRARLLRQLDQEAFERPLSVPRSKTTTPPALPGTGRSTASTTAPPLTGDRRSTAPPVPGSETRRSTNSTTSRAPAPPGFGSGTPSTSTPKPGVNRPAPDPSSIPIPPPR